eukprot:gene4927-6141_t
MYSYNNIKTYILSKGQIFPPHTIKTKYEKFMKKYTFNEVEDTLYFNRRGTSSLQVPKDEESKFQIIKSHHESNHHACEYQLRCDINKQYDWQNIKNDIKEYIDYQCSICKDSKSKFNQIPPQLDVPSHASHIGKFMIIPFPETDVETGFKYIYVLVNSFTRFVWAKGSTTKNIKSAHDFLQLAMKERIFDIYEIENDPQLINSTLLDLKNDDTCQSLKRVIIKDIKWACRDENSSKTVQPLDMYKHWSRHLSFAILLQNECESLDTNYFPIFPEKSIYPLNYKKPPINKSMEQVHKEIRESLILHSQALNQDSENEFEISQSSKTTTTTTTTSQNNKNQQQQINKLKVKKQPQNEIEFIPPPPRNTRAKTIGTIKDQFTPKKKVESPDSKTYPESVLPFLINRPITKRRIIPPSTKPPPLPKTEIKRDSDSEDDDINIDSDSGDSKISVITGKKRKSSTTILPIRTIPSTTSITKKSPNSKSIGIKREMEKEKEKEEEEEEEEEKERNIYQCGEIVDAKCKNSSWPERDSWWRAKILHHYKSKNEYSVEYLEERLPDSRIKKVLQDEGIPSYPKIQVGQTFVSNFKVTTTIILFINHANGSKPTCIKIVGKSIFCPNLPTKICTFNGAENMVASDFSAESYDNKSKSWDPKTDCPINPDQEYLTKSQFCRFYQSCDTDKDCLPLCFSHCSECFDTKTCQSKVTNGDYASKSTDKCFTPGSSVLPQSQEKLPAKNVTDAPTNSTRRPTTPSPSSTPKSSTTPKPKTTYNGQIPIFSEESINEDDESNSDSNNSPSLLISNFSHLSIILMFVVFLILH